jgi:hypothetical protein
MGSSLPPFSAGVLPPGTYELTIDDLARSVLVDGTGTDPAWDRDWRLRLVENLRHLVAQLAKAGIKSVYADGSFVSDVARPGDIDGYFEVAPRKQDFLDGRLSDELNQLEGEVIWTWESTALRVDLATGKYKLPMWHKYRIELFPHYPGVLSGIVDSFGNELEFPAAFRRTRPDILT